MKKRNLYKPTPPVLAPPIAGQFRRLRLGPVAVAAARWRNRAPGSYVKAWALQLEWWGFLKGGT